ncbi:hypothetical protein ES703_08515 [subsurface metagenome]
MSALAGGTLTASVTQTDTAGNTSDAGTDTATKDIGVPAAPVIELTDPINVANADSVSITGTGEPDATLSGTISDGVDTVPVTSAVDGGGDINITVIDVSALADGTLTASLTQTDAADNTSPAGTDEATKDTECLAPEIELTDPINVANADSVSITGTGEPNATLSGTISDGVDTVPVTGVVDGVGDISITGINVSTLADGTLFALLTQTDAAGNTSDAGTDTATKDTEVPAAPVIELTDPISAANADSVSITGTGEADATLDYTITDEDVGEVTGTGVVDALGVIDITGIDVSALADGTLTASVTQTDAALNTSDAGTDTATKDTALPAAPVVALTDPINIANETDVAITGTGEANATLNYTITDEGAGEVIGTGTVDAEGVIDITGIDVSGLADGTLTASVTQTDAIGNTSDAGTATATMDTTLTAPTWKPDVTIYQQDFTVIVTFDEVVTITAATWDTEEDVKDALTTADDKEYNLMRSGISAGTYTLSLTVEDLLGNPGEYSPNFTVETEFDIALYQGLNLISLPLVPVSTDIVAILPVTGVEHVWYYDASEPDRDLRWLVYHPASPGTSNLLTMRDGKAYWIEMSSPLTMTVTGSIYQAGATAPPVYEVFAGWNMVGFKSVVEMAPTLYFSPSDSEALTWASYSPTTGPKVDQAFLLPGEGYWVYFTAAGYIVP